MSDHRRLFLTFPLVILICALLGGAFGPSLNGVAVASAASDDDIQKSLKIFTKVYDVVSEHSAERLAPDKAIYKGAIVGMLRTLDPHSSFFDPRDFRLLREDQRGHYFGVGMIVAPRSGKTIVIAPFPGSPAYKGGIRPGDVILEVNDRRTDNLTTTEVADLLKGPRGTAVQVVVARPGAEKPITFNIVRDEIPRKSVQDAFWLKPGVAYLDIDSFNENTGKEVEGNLKRLGEQNIEALILDLRDNPGGLLSEGVAVSDRFLEKGQTIVSHRGRSSPEKRYVARQGARGKEYPIVVLVNRYSASAAEIVAGALQDHDRAWIIGENTFGKGLVQTVYPLTGNTGLALTTAKYYTPSDRLIQRDYSNTSFLDYYYHNDLDQKNPLDVKMTDSGRTVYGGGGIAPDEKFTAPKLSPFQTELLFRKYAFFGFTAKYFGSRESTKLPKGWEPDQAIITEFHDYLLKQNVKFTEAEFSEQLPWIKEQLKREFYLTAFGTEDARRYVVETDPMVIKAVEAIPQSKELLATVKKMVVQRLSKQSDK